MIPKELGEMLLEMDGFLYFASMIGDKEFDDNPYLYQAVHSIAEALKNGFFEGRYEKEYPILLADDANEKPYALELRSDNNDCAVVMLKNYDLSQVVGEPVILRGLAKGKYRIRSFPSDREEYIEVTRGELCLQDVYAIKRPAEILYIDKQ